MKWIKYCHPGWLKWFLVLAIALLLSSNPNTTSAAPTQKDGQTALEAIPAPPTLLYPHGEYPYPRPQYVWTEVTGATQYRVFISNASTGTIHNQWYFDNYVCPGVGGGSGECGLYGYEHLRTGNHTWWVKAANAEGSSDWSTPLNFRVWNTTPPTGTVSLTYPANNAVFTYWKFSFSWYPNTRATWYKVYMSDSEGKLYNQYHRAAEVCAQDGCGINPMIYEPLLHAPRALSELPTDRWIHWYVMPVNVAGNGSWSADYKFWMNPP